MWAGGGLSREQPTTPEGPRAVAAGPPRAGSRPGVRAAAPQARMRVGPLGVGVPVGGRKQQLTPSQRPHRGAGSPVNLSSGSFRTRQRRQRSRLPVATHGPWSQAAPMAQPASTPAPAT